MKQIFRILLVTLLLGTLHSCSKQDDEFELGPDSEIRPQDFSEIQEIKTTSKPANKAILIPPKITKVWNQQEYGESRFILDESISDVIYEKRSWDNTTIFTFIPYREDNNFVYAKDNSRDIYIALPIWNSGEYVHVWMRSGSGSWSMWRKVSYSSCISDTEPPSINPNNQAPEWYEAYIRDRGLNFSGSTLCIGGIGGNPPGLTDYSGVVRFYLNIMDNCDHNISHTQNPPAGTPIESSRFINGYIDFFDNNGNTTRINFQDFVRVCD